jgi:hypothetical protein
MESSHAAAAATDDLVGLIYVSSASVELRQVEMDDLLRQSRLNNRRLGITGCLLVHDDCILQYLEGPADTLDALMQRIRNDPRHHNVIELLRCRVQQRVFAGWLMAHAQVNPMLWDTLYRYLMHGSADRVPVIMAQLLSGFLRSARPSSSTAPA